ncbi:hypothetical protein SGPA1_20668 [Streptomyces misionensis JCM 4497]
MAPGAARTQGGSRTDGRQLGPAHAAGQAGRDRGQGGRCGIAGRRTGQRVGDRGQGRAAARPRPPGAAGPEPGRRAGVRHQRQDHHHPAHRGGAARRGPGRLERARRQHAGRYHLRAGGRLGRQVRRHRGRREVPGRSGPGHRPQVHRPAQPLPRPARPRRRDPDARRELARGPGRLQGGRRRQLRRPAGGVGRLLLPERDLGRGRADVEGRRLVLPVLRRRDAAPRRRLVLRRVRLPPAHALLGAVRGPRPRPARLRLADPPPAAGPRQQGQRRQLRGRRRRLRGAAAGRPGADVPGAGGRRTLRRRAVPEPGPAAAAGQEPGRLAGDLLPDRPAARPGDPVRERARGRRHRHLLAVGRRLHPADRPPDLRAR